MDIPDFIAEVDHTLSIDDKDAYEDALKVEERDFNELVRQLGAARKSLIVVLQGRDGAGKTGATTRLTEALGYDFKIFLSVPIGPPTQEELNHDYLWRFYKHERMPEYGQVRVFDRSWAERVLVERVMKLTDKDLIRASYAELRAFEWQLARQGHIIVKIWLDITKAEQKKRFKARHKDKPWKVSSSDGVAREHWDDYTPAANELFQRTGTDFAPWYLVPSEDKHYSRVAVLRIINQRLRTALGQEANDDQKS
jgi:polyphosphate kinase 2 (PPK2 family)